MAKTTKKSKKSAKSSNQEESLFKSLKGKLKASRKDLLSQVESLSTELKALKENNSTKKIIKKLDKKYKNNLASIQKEFNEQLDSLQSAQSKLLDQLPTEVLDKLNLTPKTERPKAAIKAKSSTATKNTSSLKAIKGIGPVTIKKLEAAGFTTLEDIAHPPEHKKEALKAFEKTRGYDSWQKQAEVLLQEK